MPRPMPMHVFSCIAVSLVVSAVVTAEDRRPLVSGQYEIRLGGERIGDENFA